MIYAEDHIQSFTVNGETIIELLDGAGRKTNNVRDAISYSIAVDTGWFIFKRKVVQVYDIYDGDRIESHITTCYRVAIG